MSKTENTKDKVVGKTKEYLGKATGNESLEFKGKMQSSKSDVKRAPGKAKEGIFSKINNLLDRKKK